MPLDVSKEGLWINTDWDSKKDRRGIFAVVIGVSKYDHLTGDDRSYGLGQLYVSALTAYRFFSWLKNKYRHQNLPLAKVWLLLAPTDNEIQEMQGLPSNGFRPATFENCEEAIGEWYAEIMALDPDFSLKSRALFFFSGHGLEVRLDKQILLLSDYLSPPNRNINKALSTNNLRSGLQATPLPEAFFFLDACRNDNVELKMLEVEGIPVLNPCPTSRTRSDAVYPIVHATGSGGFAWAPTDPRQGISVFGQALMECLEGRGVQPCYDNKHNCYWITFRELEDYLSPRVAKILEDTGMRIMQPVKINEAVGRKGICEVPLTMVPKAAPAGPQGPFVINARSDTELEKTITAFSKGWRGPADSKSESDLWSILRSETVTKSLWNARVFDLNTLQWINLNELRATDALTFKEINCTDDKKTYQIEVEMRQRSSQLFEVTMNGQTAACILIGDEYYQPCYTLRFDFTMDPSKGRQITGLDVSLASSSPGMLGEAAQLWNQYRWSDIGKEGEPSEFTLLEEQLMAKRESPLAATVAALLLLRAPRPDLLHDWLKNLATWFPERPDGWVIWVEQLLRTKQEKGLEDAITAFLELEKRPLPFSSEGLGLASRQVEELLQFAFPKPEDQTNKQRSRYEALKKIQQRLNKALTVFRPGGFAAVFIGPKEAVTPELIFPLDLLKAKSDISSKSAKDILQGDFKKFDFSGTKAAVGQIEVMDLADLTPKRAAILDEMNKMMAAEKLDMVVLMLTDVMKESSDLLFVGNASSAAGFEKAFGGKLANNSIYKEKCLSRKIQVIPPLESAFKD
jgi:hypothetical protein